MVNWSFFQPHDGYNCSKLVLNSRPQLMTGLTFSLTLQTHCFPLDDAVVLQT